MNPTFEKAKINQSIARLKARGNNFEIVIDPDAALKVRKGEAEAREAMMAPHIYSDIQQGERANEHLMMEIFKTIEPAVIAEKIIKEGELHFNDEYKENLRNEKKQQIIAILSRDAADANTGEPIPEKKIHTALSRVTIDLYKSVQEQIPEIVQKLRPVLAITLETKTLVIRIPADNAAKLYGFVQSRSRIIQENWLSDGAWSARVELPAGHVPGFMDELKKTTKGNAEVTVESKRK